MQRYDAVIVGHTRAAVRIADRLTDRGWRTVLVRSASAPTDPFRRFLDILSGFDGAPEPGVPAKAEVLTADPRFEGPDALLAGGTGLSAKAFVIASGARPFVPPVAGLLHVPWMEPADALRAAAPVGATLVIGAGATGVALAAALAARGQKVILFSVSARVAPRLDPEAGAALEENLTAAGVEIQTGVSFIQARAEDDRCWLVWERDGVRRETAGGRVVVAGGRASATAGLGLDKAGVLCDERGSIVVDDALRTSNARIWAAGAVVDPDIPPALEDRQCELVADNVAAPFFSRQRLEPDPVPVAFPGPLPFAHLGLDEEAARAHARDALGVTVRFPYSPANGRVRSGLLKILARKRSGRLLGVHAVGAAAGEMALYFDLVLRADIAIQDLSDRAHFPSPGTGDVVQAAIAEWIRRAES